MTGRRIIDGTLAVLVALGGVWAWRTGTERSRLQATYHRLATKTGDLAIGDRTKLHLRAIPTARSLEFAWRAFVPPGSLTLRTSTGSTFSGGNTFLATETIFRVAIREDRGRLVSFVKSSNGSSMTTFGDEELAAFFRGRWDQLAVEQVGRGEMVAADPGKPLTLLRVRLPPAARTRGPNQAVVAGPAISRQPPGRLPHILRSPNPLSTSGGKTAMTIDPATEGDVSPIEVTRGSPRRTRWSWQFGLRTTILAVAVVALAVAVVNDRRQIPVLRSRIEALRPLARELSIDDPTQVAIVKLDELWYDENQWDVYLPPGSTYRLAIATRAIDATAMSPPTRTASLAAGRHLVAIEQSRDDSKQWHLVATVDGKPSLRVDEPSDWNEGTGSSGGGFFPVSRLIPVGQPVELFRRRFTVRAGNGSSSVPTTPCPGVLLWIEVETPSLPARSR